MSEKGNTQTDDNSQMADAGGANVRISLVGFDRPFFTALAVAISLIALIFSYFTNAEEQRRVYFTQRCEAYIEQAAFDHKTVIPYQLCGPREK